jgi:hypothetical protein
VPFGYILPFSPGTLMKEFVMKRLTHIKTAFLAALFGLFMIGVAYADGGARYEVTITNITRGQVITPPVLISHKGSFELFSLGDPTIPQLATLAETGDPTDLLDYLATRSDVYDVTAADGPVLYGESVVLKIRVRGHARYLSAAGMLASTNDAFFGVRQVRVPSYGMRRITAEAYDAGSEANSELCSTIPGPPCEPPNNRDTEQAEGFVHVHSGIHGIGDLDPAVLDWRNPVVEIKIRRVRH